MSSWSQAVWTVNQIKNELNQSYEEEIDNLATQFAILQNNIYTQMQDTSTSFISTVAPSQGTESGFHPGCLCFIVGD